MSPLTKLIAVVVVGVLVILGLALYLVRPGLDTVSRLNSELKDKRVQSSTLEQQILAYKTAQSYLAQATEKDRIQEAIVTRQTLDTAIEQIESAVSLTGTAHVLTIQDPEVEVVAVRGAPAAQVDVIPGKRGISEIPYTLSVETDYAGLVNLFQYLEHLPSFTEVYEIELVADIAGGNQTTAGVHTGFIIGNINGVFFTSNEDTSVQ